MTAPEHGRVDEESQLAVLRILYEQMIRGLDRQTVVLGELRTRASIVLSASGIVASIVGADALRDPHPIALTVLALSALALGLISCLVVLWPVPDKGAAPERGWKVILTPRELDELASGATEAELLERIVHTLAPWRLTNYRTIGRRTRAFNWGCVCLALQIALWSALLLAS